MKKSFVITPNPDKGYFQNQFNLPKSSNLITNVSALLFASKLKSEGNDVAFFDYYNDQSNLFKKINQDNTEGVYLFLGYANYEHGLLLKNKFETKGIKVVLNGVYNFIDGQNFSDCSVLLERGIECEKPIVDMNIKTDYDLVASIDDLFKLQKALKQPKALAIVSQYYGCPKRANCFHCSSDKIKCDSSIKLTKTPQETIDEIMELKSKYNLDTIVLGDLMSTDFRLKQLAEHVKDKILPNLRISTAANYVTEESVAALKKLNCKELFLGIESYNEGLIRVLDKGFSLFDVDRALKLLYRAGIRAHISLILGIPGESPETLRRTFKFVKSWRKKKINKKPFIKLQVSIVTPVPGSQLYEIFKYRNGLDRTKELLMKKDWRVSLHNRYLELFIDKDVIGQVCSYYEKLSKFSDSSYI